MAGWWMPGIGHDWPALIASLLEAADVPHALRAFASSTTRADDAPPVGQHTPGLPPDDDADETISATQAAQAELAGLPWLLKVLADDHSRALLLRARVPASAPSDGSPTPGASVAAPQREESGTLDRTGDSILHYAARRGFTFWCDALLRRDALLDEPNTSQGYTPLHVCGDYGTWKAECTDMDALTLPLLDLHTSVRLLQVICAV